MAANLGYMVIRGSQPGPFFKYKDRNDQGPLCTGDTSGTICNELELHLYAGHSFRIGAATTAAEKGIQDSLIKTLGRWGNTAYMLYIRTSRETLCKVTGLKYTHIKIFCHTCHCLIPASFVALSAKQSACYSRTLLLASMLPGILV